MVVSAWFVWLGGRGWCGCVGVEWLLGWFEGMSGRVVVVV